MEFVTRLHSSMALAGRCTRLITEAGNPQGLCTFWVLADLLISCIALMGCDFIQDLHPRLISSAYGGQMLIIDRAWVNPISPRQRSQ